MNLAYETCLGFGATLALIVNAFVFVSSLKTRQDARDVFIGGSCILNCIQSILFFFLSFSQWHPDYCTSTALINTLLFAMESNCALTLSFQHFRFAKYETYISSPRALVVLFASWTSTVILWAVTLLEGEEITSGNLPVCLLKTQQMVTVITIFEACICWYLSCFLELQADIERLDFFRYLTDPNGTESLIKPTCYEKTIRMIRGIFCLEVLMGTIDCKEECCHQEQKDSYHRFSSFTPSPIVLSKEEQEDAFTIKTILNKRKLYRWFHAALMVIRMMGVCSILFFGDEMKTLSVFLFSTIVCCIGFPCLWIWRYQRYQDYLAEFLSQFQCQNNHVDEIAIVPMARQVTVKIMKPVEIKQDESLFSKSELDQFKEFNGYGPDDLIVRETKESGKFELVVPKDDKDGRRDHGTWVKLAMKMIWNEHVLPIARQVAIDGMWLEVVEFCERVQMYRKFALSSSNTQFDIHQEARAILHEFIESGSNKMINISHSLQLEVISSVSNTTLTGWEFDGACYELIFQTVKDLAEKILERKPEMQQAYVKIVRGILKQIQNKNRTRFLYEIHD